MFYRNVTYPSCSDVLFAAGVSRLEMLDNEEGQSRWDNLPGMRQSATSSQVISTDQSEVSPWPIKSLPWCLSSWKWVYIQLEACYTSFIVLLLLILHLWYIPRYIKPNLTYYQHQLVCFTTHQKLKYNIHKNAQGILYIFQRKWIA